MLDEKECLCGLTHAFAKCLYLNPSLRSTSWKGKKEVYEKINKQLKNPKLKWVIRKFDYDGLNQDNIIEISNNRGRNTQPSNLSDSETQKYISQKAAALVTLVPTESTIGEINPYKYVFSSDKLVHKVCLFFK